MRELTLMTPLPALTGNMRELTFIETKEVNGGIIPFIAAVVAVDLILIGFTVGAANGYMSTKE